MWKFIGKINKNLIIAIPFMMILGFIYGIIFSTGYLNNLIIPFTFLMVYPMMVTLKIKTVFEGGDFKAQLLTQLINFGIIPFIAFGLGSLFFKSSPYMSLGLLLAGLVPTSGMTISWTGFAKGNVAAAVKMTVVGLTIGSLASPFYIKYLMGAEIDVNIVLVIKQILLIVFLPMAAGFITQQTLIKKFGQKDFQQLIAPKFPGISTIGVLGIVFVAIALKAKSISSSPLVILYILGPLFLIYFINFFLSTIVGKLFLERGDAIALVYGSVMRNLSIALAIAINAFGTEGSSAALVVAAAYIIQVQSAAWYVKFTDKLFGKPEASVREEVRKDIVQIPQADMNNILPEINKILYATDLSETAAYAMRYACSIANKYNARVIILHVVPDILEGLSEGTGIDLSDLIGNDQKENFNADEIKSAQEIIKNRIDKISSIIQKQIPQCPVSTGDILVKVGHPVKTIITTAEENNFDFIIVGTHGAGKLKNAIIGSISGGVIRHSKLPVMVVPLP